jgi:hypothetical protein
MNEGKDRRYWNFCDVELTDAFIHGKTIYGMWADMCVSCNLEKGTGLGQLYVFRDGKWQREITRGSDSTLPRSWVQALL